MKQSLQRCGAVAVLAGASLVALPQLAAAEDWEWTVVPYLWGAATEVDVTLPSGEDVGSELDFSGLLDKLDFAAQVHFEGRRDQLGFFADVTYLGTSDDTLTPPRPILPGGATVETDADTWLVEGGGFFRLSGDTLGLDLLLGVRMVDLDLSIDITPPEPLEGDFSSSTSSTLYDGFVGLRYTTDFAGNWLFSLRGDVGTGDTDLSYNFAGTVGYRFGEDNRFGVLLGYRHLVLELKDNGFEVDQTMSGPQLGFLAQF
jgi:hypothetical protein